MNKQALYFFFLLIPLLCNAQGIQIEKYSVTINNTNKIIESYNINNKNYISINQLSYLFKNKEIKKNAYAIDLDFAKFYFLPASYFAKVQRNDIETIYQYNLLVINYNNDILIPLHSFIYSLDSMKIYQVQIEKNKILLNTYPKILEKQAKTNNTPTGYKIPKSLVRPTLQELQKGK